MNKQPWAEAKPQNIEVMTPDEFKKVIGDAEGNRLKEIASCADHCIASLNSQLSGMTMFASKVLRVVVYTPTYRCGSQVFTPDIRKAACSHIVEKLAAAGWHDPAVEFEHELPLHSNRYDIRMSVPH